MNITSLTSALTSHAKKLGIFQQVNSHEPKNSPPNGLTCSIWVGRIDPLAGGSGLNSTSVYVVFNIRLYTSMLQQPYDHIDINMTSAADKLMSAYSAGFTLGGAVRAVDLLGQYGTKLKMESGYVKHDNKIYRVMDITLPLIVNDVWNQVP